MNDCVLIEQQGNVWTFTLNRPDKRNALNPVTVEALISGVEQAHRSKADLLVFRGEGKSFCAGFDFSDFDDVSEGELLWRFVRIEQLLQLIHGSPALTMALAQGKNFGAGVDLLASCKHRVGSADATFRMPGLKFGLVLGTRRLGALVGQEIARQIQQVAATVTAERATEIGLLSQVAEQQHWHDLVARQLACAVSLSSEARADLYDVLGYASYEQDMARLVQSVVRPGLKDRIAAYRAAG